VYLEECDQVDHSRFLIARMEKDSCGNQPYKVVCVGKDQLYIVSSTTKDEKYYDDLIKLHEMIMKLITHLYDIRM